MKQDPEALYAAYGASAGGRSWDGRPMPLWAALGPAVQAHWTITALSASGLLVDRLDPGLDAVVRALGVPNPSDHPDVALVYWRVRTWARMAGAAPNGIGAMSLYAGEATAGALTAAAAELTKLSGFELLGYVALADRGVDGLPIAVADTSKIFGGIAEQTERMRASLEPSSRQRVGATLRRVALCYDQLVSARMPLATGPALRCAANFIETSYTRSAA